jgi:hypothetical protein
MVPTDVLVLCAKPLVRSCVCGNGDPTPTTRQEGGDQHRECQYCKSPRADNPLRECNVDSTDDYGQCSGVHESNNLRRWVGRTAGQLAKAAHTTVEDLQAPLQVRSMRRRQPAWTSPKLGCRLAPGSAHRAQFEPTISNLLIGPDNRNTGKHDVRCGTAKTSSVRTTSRKNPAAHRYLALTIVA